MCEVLNATSISRCYRRLRASRPRAIDSACKTGLGGSWAGSGRVKNTREEGGGLQATTPVGRAPTNKVSDPLQGGWAL